MNKNKLYRSHEQVLDSKSHGKLDIGRLSTGWAQHLAGAGSKLSPWGL
jgi:hypothetical protein